MDTAFTDQWKSILTGSKDLLAGNDAVQPAGRVTKVTGLVMEAVGLRLPVGSACSIHLAGGAKIEAEVVGFDGDRLFLMPHSDLEVLLPALRFLPKSHDKHPVIHSEDQATEAVNFQSVTSY
jgi:flagellum-specific ATP synthase